MKIVHQDEAGWKEGIKKAWLWVAVTSLVTVFMVDLHRSADVAKRMLGLDFKGILNPDRWSAYNWMENRQRQLCWSHSRRVFQVFVERGGESQSIGEALLAQVHQMFTGWHAVKNGNFAPPQFQEQMHPMRIDVGALLRKGITCSHHGTAGTCRDMLKHEEALWTFVDVPGIEPTNILAERQICPGVLWRKGSFGTQSAAGGRFIERIMTVVSTLKQQDRNVLDYARPPIRVVLSLPCCLPIQSRSGNYLTFYPLNDYKLSFWGFDSCR
jgi:transposase